MALFQICIFKSGLIYVFVHSKARESKGRGTHAFTAAQMTRTLRCLAGKDESRALYFSSNATSVTMTIA